MFDHAYRPTRREVLQDIGLAAAIAAVGVFEYFMFADTYVDNSVIENTRQPGPLLLSLTVLTIAPVGIRRRFPVTAAVVGHGFFVITTGLDFQITSAAQFSLLIPFYGLALYVPPQPGDVVRGAIVAAMVGWTTLGAIASGVPSGLILLTLVVYVATWMVGNNARARIQNSLLLEERAARAERDRERSAARAVATERARIARELHDVVAHSITVMTVQATGAKRIIGTKPDQAKHALEAIEATGRQALGEMRRMVGVMRGDAGDIGLEPQPGLAGLAELFEQIEASGVELEWSVRGEATPAPPGVELTAYRVVQEALTNTIKHAGPNAKATVEVRYENGDLAIEIIDSGRGVTRPGDNGAEPGHGLLGMRERVVLYGGSFDAGPRAGGGYRVAATIPFEVDR